MVSEIGPYPSQGDNSLLPLLHARSRTEEFLDYQHKFIGVCLNERIISATDNNEFRIRDAIAKYLHVVHRYGLIIRPSHYERRTCDLGQATPSVERYHLSPIPINKGGLVVDHLPAISFISSVEVGNDRIRPVRLASVMGSSPALERAAFDPG